MADEPSLNITLEHYRCFSKTAPVSFTLHKGQTLALIGKNNVGKSALMRFFYELKNVLTNFRSGGWAQSGNMLIETNNNSAPFGTRYGLGDFLELFPNRDSSEPLSFSFSYSDVFCSFSISGPSSGWVLKKTLSVDNPNLNATIHQIFNNTLYIGSHRNLVNQGAGGASYYDLSVGSAFVVDWDALKNGVDAEKARLALKAETLIADLFGWQSISINKSSDGTQLYMTSQKGREALSQLGAGVSEIILCIVTAAVKRPSWILIDEPE